MYGTTMLHVWRILPGLVLAILALSSVAVSQNVSPAPEPRPGGILSGSVLLYNGDFHTMDDSDTVASVVAIRDGTIVYVGDDQRDARRQFLEEDGGSSNGKNIRHIDLGGRLALPGLIDAHNHFVLFGNRPGHHTPLENAYSMADVQKTLSDRARAVPEGEWVTTIGGFHTNQFAEGRLPTLQELDESDDGSHPIFVMVGFFGPSVVNSAGRDWLLEADPSIVVATDGGLSAGGFVSAGDTGKALLALRRRHGFEERKRGVRDAMGYAAAMGVTTHLDQGAFPATGTATDGAGHEDNYAMHRPFMAVYAEGGATVRLRINFLHMDTDPELPALRQRMANTWPFFGNDMVRTGGMGEFISADSADAEGGPVFGEAANLLAETGWRVEVHSLTDEDYKAQIETFERADAAHGIKDLRWVVAHVPLITPEWLQRLKAVGGGVSLTSWLYLAGTGPHAGPPLRDIVESGIPAGYGADGMQIAPLNPWIHMYYAVTGKNARGEVINDGQQISRQKVLEMYTRNNQWFLGGPDEKLLGAIEVGRLGDIIVLNDDYFTVENEDMKKLRSVLTVVGGEVVHDKLSNPK